jgi:hypothetical protein
MRIKSLGQMMSLLAVLSVLCLTSRSLAKSAHVVTHVVQEDETAWFLASVYYGNGNAYTKILETNKLVRPEDVKVGMSIQIQDPKYFKEQIDFSNRYAKLWEVRQKALGLQTGTHLPKTLVVIPTETIRSRDTLEKLPAIEVRETGNHVE